MPASPMARPSHTTCSVYGRAGKDEAGAWPTATHIGDLVEAPNSYFILDPALALVAI